MRRIERDISLWGFSCFLKLKGILLSVKLCDPFITSFNICTVCLLETLPGAFILIYTDLPNLVCTFISNILQKSISSLYLLPNYIIPVWEILKNILGEHWLNFLHYSKVLRLSVLNLSVKETAVTVVA